MRDRRDARQAEQLGHHRADLLVVVVHRQLAEEDQIVAAGPELAGQRLGHLEAVSGAGRLEQHRAVDAHGERGAEGFLGRVGAHRVRHGLAGTRLLFPGEGFFYRELVVGIEDELEPGFVDRLAIGAGDDLGDGVRHPLKAYRDLQRALPLLA